MAIRQKTLPASERCDRSYKTDIVSSVCMENADYDSCHEWVRGELRCVDVPDIEMVKSAEELDGTNVETTARFLLAVETHINY